MKISRPFQTILHVLLILFGCLSLVQVQLASAQSVPTGSRIKGSGSSSARQTVHFSDSGKIERIKSLLNRGALSEARSMAEDYVEYQQTDVMNSESLYHAYNALCAVHIKEGLLDLAVSVCTNALDAMPGQWSALNNRGTAFLLQEKFSLARTDFSAALDVASKSQHIREVISHNLALLDELDEKKSQ